MEAHDFLPIMKIMVDSFIILLQKDQMTGIFLPFSILMEKRETLSLYINEVKNGQCFEMAQKKDAETQTQKVKKKDETSEKEITISLSPCSSYPCRPPWGSP